MHAQKGYKNRKAQRTLQDVRAILRSAGVNPKDVPTLPSAVGVAVKRAAPAVTRHSNYQWIPPSVPNA